MKKIFKIVVYSNNMEFVAICRKGIETLCEKELKGKKIFNCCVVFSKLVKKKPRVPYRILRILAYGTIKKIEDLKKIKIDEKIFSKLVKNKDTFRITTITDNSNISKMVCNEKLGEMIHKKYNLKVNLTKPDKELIFFVSDNRFVFGIDYLGDLSERDYRVFTSNKSIQPNLAAAMLMLAGYKKGKILVNVFCRDGTLAIEANLLSKEKVFAVCDRISYLNNSKNNIKIARAKVEVSKTSIDYLDTVFNKEGVDIIIGRAPSSGKNTTLLEVEKLADELFYQSKYILKKRGVVVLGSEKPQEILKFAYKHGFVLKEEMMTQKGEEKLYLIKLEKEK